MRLLLLPINDLGNGYFASPINQIRSLFQNYEVVVKPAVPLSRSTTSPKSDRPTNNAVYVKRA